ncbi:MAG: NINE protein [Saprospiraceae bacterium]|nr:NINE protein [Saprospiraceae bacterium]
MEKSRIGAAFMALFFGAFGVHKFYLRDTGAGIFYIALLFFSIRILGMPISGLLGLFDAIRLFSMSEEDFDAKYNRPTNRRRHLERRREYRGKSTQKRRDMNMERKKYQYNRTTSKNRDNPFKRSGQKKYKDYDLEGALEDYNKALEISPDDKDIYFDLAVVYSLMEDADKGYECLERAVNLGFKDTKRILEYDDLAYLRIQEEFETFKNNGFQRTKDKKALPMEDLLKDDLLLSQLNKLKDLRSRGLLSEKEFVHEKEKLFRK